MSGIELKNFVLLLVSALWLSSTITNYANAVTLLRDDFNGDALDLSTFLLPSGPGTFFGQTQIRAPSLPPDVSDGVLTLLLDTHNPTALVPGDSFLGSEIRTREVFEVETGLSLRSRLRFVDPPEGSLPGGIVGGFFTFGLEFPFGGGPIRDEIDFELLTNDLGQESIFTNVFDDDGFNQAGDFVNASAPGLDITEFAEYEIRLFPDRIEFLVNGSVVRVETDTLAIDPQDVRININVPNGGFVDAFNPAFEPVASAADNEQFALEVDFLEVRRLTPGDFNVDGVVDAADFTGFRDGFGETGAGLLTDGNRDEQVDSQDLAFFAQNFSASGAAGFASTTIVPEPASGALAAAGLSLALGALYRRAGRTNIPRAHE